MEGLSYSPPNSPGRIIFADSGTSKLEKSIHSYRLLPRGVVLETLAIAGLAALYACGGGNGGGNGIPCPTCPSGDTTPPVISNLRINGNSSRELPPGTTTAIIEFLTDEDANCKISETRGVEYRSMPQSVDMTGGRTHTHKEDDRQDGVSYARFIKCMDAAENANPLDFDASYSVGRKTTTTIKGTVIPASALTGRIDRARFILEDETRQVFQVTKDLGEIVNGSFTFNDVPIGTFKYRIEGDGLYNRDGTIIIPSGEESTYSAIKVAKRHTENGMDKEIMARIDYMSRSDAAAAGIWGEKPTVRNGLVIPIEPLDMYYDATIKSQSEPGRREHLKTIPAIFNKLRTVDPFFQQGWELFYVCDPANKPADVPRCDTPTMPEDGAEGKFTMKYGGTGTAGATNFSWVRNNYRGYNNVAVSGMVLLHPEVSAGGIWTDSVEPLIGFQIDYQGPGQSKYDSTFNDNFNNADSITRLDEIIIQTHFAMLPATLTAFDDSNITSLSPTATRFNIFPVSPTYTSFQQHAPQYQLPQQKVEQNQDVLRPERTVPSRPEKEERIRREF